MTVGAAPETTRAAAGGRAHLEPQRTVGLFGATGVGVGAIVGGGILVLAGVAFSTTGPSAMVAFAVNGFIAVLTALSFAEMSTSFPESGGAYTFAKKVLSVRAAFGVGWILWFAYIVAGVLYALGFASYAVAILGELWTITGDTAPAWLSERRAILALAIGAAATYTLSLIRKATGGGEWATWGKVVVFVVLIAAGVWALIVQDISPAEKLTPFFPKGSMGLLQAMGFTFIALQGFDLIAAIAGEVKQPERTIPRAMLLSLGAALAIYLPLLFVVSTVGVEPEGSIMEMSEQNPETVMAVAVRNYLGAPGYWFVMVAAVLSTLSALHANILAASRVAFSMATDRTLPTVLGQLHEVRRTPVMAIYATALALVAILLMVPDLAAAGAAASLIFLIAFALAHWTSILARMRSGERVRLPLFRRAANNSVVTPAPGFTTPFFPLVPIVGGGACLAMAVFQGVAVPAAGGITAIWLGLGVLLYFALFSSRARAFDAFAEARDPALVRLRGRTPLVLVPIANPDNAPALVAIAAALAPPPAARVLLLSVIRPRSDESLAGPTPELLGAQAVLREALAASLSAGHAPEALMTIAPDPWTEIARVARAHRCEGILLGMKKELGPRANERLEAFLDTVDSDVAFLHAPEGWRLDRVRRILVPIGGRGQHYELRARLLGSFSRALHAKTTWLTVLPTGASKAEQTAAQRALRRLALDKTQGTPTTEIVSSDDAGSVVIDRAGSHDLLILGLQRLPNGRRLFGNFAMRVVREAPCAVILISRRG